MSLLAQKTPATTSTSAASSVVLRGTSATTGSTPHRRMRPEGGARRSPAPLGRIPIGVVNPGCSLVPRSTRG